MIDRKINVKAQTKMSHTKVKSVIPSPSPSTQRTSGKSVGPPPKTLTERLARENKTRLPTTTGVTSLKHPNERKGSLRKSQATTPPVVYQEKGHSSSQISLASKSEGQQKDTLTSTIITTDSINTDNVSQLQTKGECVTY
jgi:hypothetical protein